MRFARSRIGVGGRVLGGALTLAALVTTSAVFADGGDALERHARTSIGQVNQTTRGIALVRTATDRFGDGDTIVRFAQTHHGLPVIGRGAVARISKAGVTLRADAKVESDLPVTTLPTIMADAAARTAERWSRGSASAADAHLVVWPLRGGGSRLAYAVLPKVPAGIPSAPRVIVDAETGDVLEARDLIRFARAFTYPANPTSTPTPDLLPIALTPGAKLTSDFIDSNNCIDNKTVRPVNMYGFNAKVHVCDMLQTATANSTDDFVYPPVDDGSPAARSDTFSEVSMYYHASRAYDFFRKLSGVADAQVVEDKPLRLVANLQIPSGLQSGNFAQAADPDRALEPFSNAFFSPASGGLGEIFAQIYGVTGGGLWFGQGPNRDYSYDGDVVYHEFTHAVVDKTLKLEAWHIDARGVIDAPGAMNEGLADYFSSALAKDPNVGEYASKDLAAGLDAIRKLDNQDKCPANVSGEVHADSTLFSGALWEARMSLAEDDRMKFDAALYKSMRENAGSGDLGYDDLGKLFLGTLATDLPAGKTALETALTNRGVLPSCERIFEYTDHPISPIDKSLGGFAAPGAQTVGLSGLAPGLIQVHAKITGKPAKVTLQFDAFEGQGSASPFGNATPFTPVVLAKFGQAITWSVKGGKASHDADATAPVDSTIGGASFDIPDGATDVWLQVANKGESDGAYARLTVAFVPQPASAPATTEPATTSTTSTTTTTDDGGCGCVTVGGSSRSSRNSFGLAALLGVMATIAGLARRRRAS
ncbi:hypothetical protein [Labilithrix luteola]|nr:hypothetical protein [Labilithrix luteola]